MDDKTDNKPKYKVNLPPRFTDENYKAKIYKQKIDKRLSFQSFINPRSGKQTFYEFGAEKEFSQLSKKSKERLFRLLKEVVSSNDPGKEVNFISRAMNNIMIMSTLNVFDIEFKDENNINGLSKKSKKEIVKIHYDLYLKDALINFKKKKDLEKKDMENG